ncbi:MAG: hypothetical protein ACHQWU_14295, partial [Gemmatimonadales bacterium]
MNTNNLKALHDAGQSIWLDFIDRTMLRNGDLARRIRDDALTGMTSNVGRKMSQASRTSVVATRSNSSMAV